MQQSKHACRILCALTQYIVRDSHSTIIVEGKMRIVNMKLWLEGGKAALTNAGGRPE